MIGERLHAARRLANLSQAEVGRRMGVTSMAISKYERGLVTPDGQRLVRLAEVLDTSVAELLRPQAELDLAVASYRWHPLKRQSRRAAEAAEARVHEWLERYLALEELLAEHPLTTTSSLRAAVGQTSDPEQAAALLRDHWQVGGDAIESMVDVLEDNGVKVLALADAGPVDACAYEFDGGHPAIAVSRTLPDGSSCPGDRERFSLAHELGHLILDDGKDHKAREAAAHRFAAAFLVPAEAARRELGETRSEITASELALLKQKYGLSMQAWLRRARELDILAPAAASAALAAGRAGGWEQSEPVQVSFEEPQRLQRLALRAWAEGIVSESRATELSGCQRAIFRRMRGNAAGAVLAWACA
jgi:Zn-dependent peptidase ImmA (M78 family)/transcriptional regulator with XRE-family HTH domain